MPMRQVKASTAAAAAATAAAATTAAAAEFYLDPMWIPYGFKMDSITNLYGRFCSYVGSIRFLDSPDVESMQLLYIGSI